jgi:DNA-binding CsgD family transcriptional regulator
MKMEKLGRPNGATFPDGSATPAGPASGILLSVEPGLAVYRLGSGQILQMFGTDLTPEGAGTIVSGRISRIQIVPAGTQAADEALHWLRGTMQMTQAEAEIAVAIGDGQSLNEIAASRKVSIHTVRNQVKSTLSKAGARRQADLVRLVALLRASGTAV